MSKIEDTVCKCFSAIKSIWLAHILFYIQMAREGYRQSMEILLREKVLTKKKRERLINSFDKNRIAPLHYAARYDHVDIMELLIAHGANVDIKDKEEGLTPLHFCAR